MKKYNIMDIPDAQSGDWKVWTQTISEEDAKYSRMSAIFNGGRGSVKAGDIKMLSRNGTIVMSNTPDEMSDHWEFIREANGRVLVNGLGLGAAIAEILNDERKEIELITVIEASEDVIKLVAPFFEKDKRVEIIHADAYTYQPPKGVRYNVVWHDIWDTICADNLEEMGKLHRKYGRKTDWQGSWAKPLCLAQRREERRYCYY